MPNRVLTPLFLIVLVDLLALTMIVPLLPFLAQKFGASAFEIGLLASAFAVCQLVAGPVMGFLSDRHGRRPVLVASQLGTFAGLLLMAYADSLLVLFVARIVDGFTAGNLPVAQAVIADHTPPEKRAGAFAKIGVAFGLGLVLGPALSGWLAGFSWQYPIFFAAGLSATSVVLSLALLPSDSPRPNTSPPLFAFFARRELRPWLFKFAIFVLAFGWFSGGFALVAQGKLGFGPREVGFLLAYCGVLGVVVQGFGVARLVPVFGEAKLATAGFCFLVVGYSLLGITPALLGFLVGCTLFSIGNSLLRPSLTSLLSANVGASEQGAVLGLTSSLQSLGQIVGPPAGNLFLDGSAYAAWAICLAALAALGLLKTNASARPLAS